MKTRFNEERFKEMIGILFPQGYIVDDNGTRYLGRLDAYDYDLAGCPVEIEIQSENVINIWWFMYSPVEGECMQYGGFFCGIIKAFLPELVLDNCLDGETPNATFVMRE